MDKNIIHSTVVICTNRRLNETQQGGKDSQGRNNEKNEERERGDSYPNSFIVNSL